MKWRSRNAVGESKGNKAGHGALPPAGTAHRTIVLAAAASSAAENVPEDITEDVSHIGSIEIEAAKSTGTAACAALECGMTKLVILSSLLRVA